MNTKTLCSLSTYIAFIVTLRVLYVPGLNVPIIIVGFMLSAAYLEILPFSVWIKTQIALEISNLPTYYRGIIELRSMMTQANLAAKLKAAIVWNELQTMLGTLPHARVEQITSQIDEMFSKNVINYNLAFLFIPLCLLIKTGVIYLCHRWVIKNNILRGIKL